MRIKVLGFLCGVAAIAYVQRSAISVPASEIADDLRFTDLKEQMGIVQSAWYLGYALLQMPSGWLADRIGSRLALAGLCILWSMLTLVTGFCTDFLSLTTLWFFMGAAQAGAFPCAAKAIGQMFPETERARASGFLASGMAIGGALAPLIAGQTLTLLDSAAESLEVYRWRLLLFLFAVPGILWSIAFLMTVRPHHLPLIPQTSRVPHSLMWRRVFSSGSLALLCAQQFLRAAAMVFFMTWFPTFLQKTRGVDVQESGLLTTVAGTGGVLGSLAGGIVSDWLLMRTGNRRLSRQGIAVLGMGSCALLITFSYFVANTWLSISIISLGAFCATFGGVSGYTVAIEFGGKQTATVFSLMNMCGNFGAALFPATAGWLVARTGNWNIMLFFFAAIMAVDAVCWAILNPRQPLFTDDQEELNHAAG
jgi:MFS family permease